MSVCDHGVMPCRHEPAPGREESDMFRLLIVVLIVVAVVGLAVALIRNR